MVLFQRPYFLLVHGPKPTVLYTVYCTVAKFIVPDEGDKVDSGIVLSYNNPMPESSLSPHLGTMNSSTGLGE